RAIDIFPADAAGDDQEQTGGEDDQLFHNGTSRRGYVTPGQMPPGTMPGGRGIVPCNSSKMLSTMCHLFCYPIGRRRSTKASTSISRRGRQEKSSNHRITSMNQSMSRRN